MPPLTIWVDTGGTFTDAMALDAEGRLRRAKVLSTGALRGSVRGRISERDLEIDERWSVPRDFVRGFTFRLLGVAETTIEVEGHDPDTNLLRLAAPLESEVAAGAPFEVVSPEEAPLLAARLLARTAPGSSLAGVVLRLGTTLGTNALLERRGVATALFITRGFGDLLRIGTQQRPDLFALDIRRPEPFYDRVIEVPERLAADGSVLDALDAETMAREAAALVDQGVRVAAVALLHAYRNPEHERTLARVLAEGGFEHVSCSSELAPSIKILQRAQTAVVDAYLAPVVRAYLGRVTAGLDGGRLHVMTSAGGLVSPEAFRPKDSLLSGPAGGVVGAAAAGRRSGFERVLVFDMGGTSTDVARVDGDYEYEFEHRVGDAELMAPALAIESVAAGGGSQCWFDGHRLRVGPRSAGADPGPACYGAGGPLTLTDVNLLSGRLDPRRFGIPIDTEMAAERLTELRDEVNDRPGQRIEREPLLDGLLAIADETMADAIRRVSLRKGYDPVDYALVAFGGAGAQHACGVARRLGIQTIVVPADPGLLSAFGLGHAVLERFAERQVLQPLDEVESDLVERLRELERDAARAVALEGVPRETIEVRRRIARLRFAGQDSTLEVEITAGRRLGEAFEERYQELFGHRPEGRAVELESLRVIASSPAPGAAAGGAAVSAERGAVDAAAAVAGGASSPTLELRRTRLDGEWHSVPVFDRKDLRPATAFDGPALVFEPHSATVIERDWRCRVDDHGALILSRRTPAGVGKDVGARRLHALLAETGADPYSHEAVRLELFTHRFRTIAREMGERLRQTAVSTNVKERMDFSCALLDADGALVVNAPHIPVHLGAIGLCVRELMRRIEMQPGDVVVTNHPAFGGSHLPDVTVVTPVHLDSGERLGFVASRAHHAEIGGARPGSMPPNATRLADEGVVLPPIFVVRHGAADWSVVRDRLLGGPHPSRAPEDNLADLRAAVAANHAGVQAMRSLAALHGPEAIRLYMDRLKAMAARHLGEALRRLGNCTFRATEALDDGTPLSVTIELSDGRATIDFAGSGDVHPGNLNATPAIVHSAVIYVLRLLIREPLPLNEGLLQPVEIRIPRGLLDPGFPDDPGECPAVVGGNVETSQRIVDTLIKALGLAACSQGTMNNVIFGNQQFGYYETVCGGCGAGADFDGADAVHSHMTNTRITDPEIVEHRYPVRVERFAIRRGSGGAGRHRGGDGAVREFTFLDGCALSLLTQHRTVAPYGLEGGEPGAAGRQRVVRASGDVVELGSIEGCEVGAGDRLVLETPGGGGYGSPGS